MQVLYELAYSNGAPGEAFDASEAAAALADDEQRVFARALVEGVWKSREEIDPLIAQFSTHWRPERLAIVDRAILRLGVYELLHRHDIPPRVTINEAVELGKRFGAADTGAFINGLLDRIFKEVLPSRSGP